MGKLRDASEAYRMRWKRRRFLFRAFRSRRQLEIVSNKTAAIKPDSVLAFSTVRNEALRLPYFLDYYRALGVDHFFMVDNSSDDGTLDLLQTQPDVSVWSTSASYKASRFGMDWLNWLLTKYGSGNWCLTVDADELLVFPHWQSRGLAGLTDHLDQTSTSSFGSLMLDLYPKGRLSDQPYEVGADPLKIISWFDATQPRAKRQRPMQNLWVQGGVRERVFFSDSTSRSPTLNKIPLVRWKRGFVYMNSTHSMLPPKLNAAFMDFGLNRVLSGALLHTKFLNDIVVRSMSEKARAEHFGNSRDYDAYYDRLIENPELWNQNSVKYENWEQLEALGLISRGSWT